MTLTEYLTAIDEFAAATPHGYLPGRDAVTHALLSHRSSFLSGVAAAFGRDYRADIAAARAALTAAA